MLTRPRERGAVSAGEARGAEGARQRMGRATLQRTRRSPTARRPRKPVSTSLPGTRGAPSALLPRACAPGPPQRPQSPRTRTSRNAARSAPWPQGRGRVVMGASLSPHTQNEYPRQPVDAARPSPGLSRPAAALCWPGPPRAVWAALGGWSLGPGTLRGVASCIDASGLSRIPLSSPYSPRLQTHKDTPVLLSCCSSC